MAIKSFKNYYEIKDDITVIYMKNRKCEIFSTIIDTKNLNKIIEFGRSWYVKHQRLGNYYAYCTIYRKNLNPLTYSLHQLLMNIVPGNRELKTDHINYDTLDNRKENLRIVTQKDNLKHRKNNNSNNKTGYRNVCLINNKWVIQLQIDDENKRLGSFEYNELDKAITFADEMRKIYYGKFSN